MNLPQLGTLEEVNLREAWSHEAHSFTPWLSEHLDKLSEQIGIPLELVGQEVAVDTFSADILARNPQDDSFVLIENQLEKTDHTHLGQIMTYLAGLDTQTVIWVAADFRDAHLSALKWLNEHTVEPFAFFAIQVKAVKIGNSSIAPLFEVMMRPNHWERHLQAVAKEKRSISNLGEFRKNFWSHYLDKYPDECLYGEANGSSNRYYSLDDVNLVVSIYLAQKEIGIYIRSPKGIDNENAYETLKPYTEELKQILDVSLGDLDKGHFFCSSRKSNSKDTSQWDELCDWFYRKRNNYMRALQGFEY